MGKGYDDVYDVDSMDDDELRSLILEQLAEEESLDAEGVEVTVRDGAVRVRGRLGTEDEVEAVETIIVDRLGIDDFESELIIDELVRVQAGEAADDSERRGYERSQRGERTDPEAEHLIEDVEGELYGTEDMQKAIEQGEAYTPPDAPHREGTRSGENP